MGLIILNSVEVAQAFGEGWAAALQGGEIITLSGVLGAGKTQLVKGLARGLGFRGQVTSPTFTLVNEYVGGRLTLYHIDLYRVKSEDEAIAFGIEEYIPSPGVTVIEWPERIEALLPPETEQWDLHVASLTERIIQRRGDA
jgi:tRNA threonylcarbamoyladenosine biosynthesis protein TsaE